MRSKLHLPLFLRMVGMLCVTEPCCCFSTTRDLVYKRLRMCGRMTFDSIQIHPCICTEKATSGAYVPFGKKRLAFSKNCSPNSDQGMHLTSPYSPARETRL
jgi:hypothetical protein